MAIPGGLTPFEDFVSVSYELINYNTLQPITHSGNYAEVNNSQFIFLKVHSLLTGFDKRVNRILLTFKQYTNLNYQVNLKVSNAGQNRWVSSDGFRQVRWDVSHHLYNGVPSKVHFNLQTYRNPIGGLIRPGKAIENIHVWIDWFGFHL